MAAITYLTKTDTTLRTEVGASLVEITERTISWSDLTTAGFAASDVVFIIWNWSLGEGSTTAGHGVSNFGHGTSFAGRTDWFPVDTLVETMSASSQQGDKFFGWVEEHTLVTSENIYFGLANGAGVIGESSNFSCTVIKQADLAVGDWRYDAQANAVAVTTDFVDGRDAQVTLPSDGGDDWLIIACGNWDVATTSISFEQQINIDGVGTVMLLSCEGEDTNEQLPLMCVYPLASAATSQVVTFEGRESASSSFVLDSSRVLAIRLNAFADHQLLTDTTTDTFSTADTYVETATISLSLSATGPVFVIGQSIVDAPASGVTNPYMRLQEGNSDIVTDMGRYGDWSRDPTDLLGVVAHAIGSMTNGTKTIDMDVANEVSNTSTDVIERSLIAFSLELAAAAGSVGASFGSATVSGTSAADKESDGASSGTATITGEGASDFDGVGAASGSAVVAGTSAADKESQASASGIATVAGEGASEFNADANASGAAAVNGVGEADFEAVASASGIATVNGVGDSEEAGSVAAASGIAIVAGIGESDAEAIAEASGSATVLGLSSTEELFRNVAEFTLYINPIFQTTQAITKSFPSELSIATKNESSLSMATKKEFTLEI